MVLMPLFINKKWSKMEKLLSFSLIGFEATLKKFSKQGNLVILEPMSDDPNFNTQVYGTDTQIKILGKYVGKFEMNK